MNRFCLLIISCITLVLNVSFSLPEYSAGSGFPRLFDKISYDSVVAYDFNGNGHRPIVKEGFLNRRSIIKQVVLTNGEVKQLNGMMGNKATFGGTTYACFDPHLGFVYFSKGRITAHISVCLNCNYLESEPKIPYESFPRSGSDTQIHLNGFSKKGAQQFSDFCTQFDFSHCKKTTE